MVRCVTAACFVAIVSSACTFYQEQSIEKGEDAAAASSFPASSYPDAEDDSTSGEDSEGGASTGADASSTGEPDAGSTGEPDAGSTKGDDGSSTSGSTGDVGSSSTGDTPIESSTTDASSTTGEQGSTSGEPIDQTTGGESSSTTGEPAPEPEPDPCEQLSPGACGTGLCFAPEFACVGNEAYVPGANLQPGEMAQIGAGSNQRVVHVLEVPAGPYNLRLTPITGGAKVDYRLYSSTGEIIAAGAPGGIVQVGLDKAQPAVYLLTVGENLGKIMTHEAKLSHVPTKNHNEQCDVDAQCLSGFCRASAFDAAPRCLTPCTRATVLDCANKGLPGLCVETGADKTLLCAGTHKLQVEDLYDNKVCAVNNVGACASNISDANDVDVWLVNGGNTVSPYYARWGTNGAFASKIKGVWLDGSGAKIGEEIVPTNGKALGPLRPAKSWTWLLLSSSDGTTNGFGLTPYTP